MDVEWARLKAQDLRRLAAQDAIVVLPVASIEQHGPHLPVMTDTRLGAEVAHRAARIVQAARPIVVAPVVWAGLSEHHMPFGGTLTLDVATYKAVLKNLTGSMVRLGFKVPEPHGLECFFALALLPFNHLDCRCFESVWAGLAGGLCSDLTGHAGI